MRQVIIRSDGVVLLVPVPLLQPAKVSIGVMRRHSTKVVIDSNRVTIGIGVSLFFALGRLASGFIVPVRSHTILSNLVHFTGSNLDLHVPLLAVPFGGSRIVQGLVSIALWVGNVIFESRITSRCPSLGASLLSIVAQGPVSGSSDSIRFVGTLLLRLQYDAKSECIRNLQNVIKAVTKHLLPSGVRLLHTGGDREVFHTMREDSIVLQEFRHLRLHLTEDLLHAITDIGLRGTSKSSFSSCQMKAFFRITSLMKQC
mmetsp:Transcript_100217/g.289370  ORF Transcript_100217/g.289370 Transcript_100217/m.289370 type:complete len:257 (+) Transcript_100217:397-1167(+)